MAEVARGEMAKRPPQPWPKKTDKKKPLQPPGISGTVASLVISPDFFAGKETTNTRKAAHWWSPGKKKSIKGVGNLVSPIFV